MDLVIATKNVHKLRELKAMIRLPGLDIYSLYNFSEYEPCAEEGSSFAENAEMKALHAARVLQKWVLADDSGLIVPALAGEPGIYSRRYAGLEATDRENRKKLLDRMKDLQGMSRSASFQCTLALANVEGVQKVVTGICEGSILDEERGSHGFGYDPLFLENSYNQTYAQLAEETKNRISHRRKAVDKLIPFLGSVLVHQPLC